MQGCSLLYNKTYVKSLYDFSFYDINFSFKKYLNKYNNQSIRFHNNGDKYVGNHINDVRSGKGLYLFANGDSYNGNWVNGNATGKGILKFINGDENDGEFKDNSFSVREL